MKPGHAQRQSSHAQVTTMTTCRVRCCTRLNGYALPSISSNETVQQPSIYSDNNFCSIRCAKRYWNLCAKGTCKRLTKASIPTPTGTVTSVAAFNENAYCSKDCSISSQDDRYLHSIERIGGLFSKLYLSVAVITSELRLFCEEDTAEELRLYVVPKHPQFDAFPPIRVTKKGREALLSHNECVKAVRLFAGALAFLQEGNNTRNRC